MSTSTHRLPLSVYYITLNEELRLPRSLAKIMDWADEVIVVDSGSTDSTCAIAEQMGARVVYNAWQGFAAQKAFAAGLCKNDWVLDLDADEVLSDELIAEIKTLFESSAEPDEAAFLITWESVYPFDEKPRLWSHKNHIIRLYNRNKAAIQCAGHFSNDDRPKVQSGEVGKLKGVVYHYSIINLTEVERKYSTLSTEQAMHYFAKSRKISTLRIYLEFPLQFLKYYLFRRAFMGGWYGFVLSIMAANRLMMRLAKLKEMYLLAERDSKKDR